MTLLESQTLKNGDILRHNGNWANRIGLAKEYEVLSVDESHLRVKDSRGFVSLYTFGCALFVTRDFLASCTQNETGFTEVK
jgi:hypothetical protein